MRAAGGGHNRQHVLGGRPVGPGRTGAVRRHEGCHHRALGVAAPGNWPSREIGVLACCGPGGVRSRLVAHLPARWRGPARFRHARPQGRSGPDGPGRRWGADEVGLRVLDAVPARRVVHHDAPGAPRSFYGGGTNACLRALRPSRAVSLRRPDGRAGGGIIRWWEASAEKAFGLALAR